MDNAILTMKGFASGFLGEKIDDIGSCGTNGIAMLTKLGDVVVQLFYGRVDTYFKAFSELVEVFTALPQEFSDCQSLKNALDKLISRTTTTLNPTQFLQNMAFNLIFHIFDILSALAYAAENALDQGFYDSGVAAGNALNIFLFNDSSK